MRAIQVTRFGGPEVLELVELPDPDARQGDSQRLAVESAGVNYADTHQTADDYLARQTLPLRAGRRGRRPARRRPTRVVALLSGGGYAEQALAHPADDVRAPRRGRRRHGAGRSSCRAPPPGTCCGPARTSRPGSPCWSCPQPAVWAALPSSSPRRWARPGDRDRVDARTSATWPRPGRRRGHRVARGGGRRRTSTRAIREANGGTPVDIVLEMTGGAVFDALAVRPGTVRPARHLRHGVARAAVADRRSAG